VGTVPNQTAHLASAFRGASLETDQAAAHGLEKARATVVSHLRLTEPAEITQAHFHANQREIAFEVKDFLGVRARANVDVNGIIRAIKRVTR